MTETVLIAHGNTQQLKQSVDLLRRIGFEVAATPDGGDAFARFFECDPALVICSIALPSLDGPNFARMVRSQAPEVPVIILTHGEDVSEANLPGDEHVHVMPEPLLEETLRHVVPTLLSAAQEEQRDRATADDWQVVAPSTTNVFIHSALRRFQRDSNLLGMLDATGLRLVAGLAAHESHDDGVCIIRQGERGDSFYLVVEGQVRVTLEEKGDREVARIEPGGFFGEMALLSDAPRSASVWTAGPTTLLRFERDAFLPVLDRYPVLRDVLNGVASKRTEENLWRVLFDDAEVTESIESLDTAGTGLLLDEATVPEEEPEPREDTDTAEEIVVLAPEPEPESGLVSEPDTANDAGVEPEPEPEPELSVEQGVTEPSLDVARALTASAPGRDDEHVIGLADVPVDVDAQLEALRGTEDPRARLATQASVASRALYRRGLVMGLVVGLLAGSASTFVSTSGDEVAAWVSALVAELRLADTGDMPAASGPGSSAPRALGSEAAESTVTPAEETLEPELIAPESVPAAEAQPPEVEVAAPANAQEGELAVPTEADAAPTFEDKKAWRRALMAARAAGRFPQAISAAEKLAQHFGLDWEAQFAYADALRQNGDIAAAYAQFADFVTKYPGNLYGDDALFWMAEIAREAGRVDEARGLYQRVLGDPKSDFHASAQARLEAMGQQ